MTTYFLGFPVKMPKICSMLVYETRKKGDSARDGRKWDMKEGPKKIR
jgi:hypothetical protein